MLVVMWVSLGHISSKRQPTHFLVLPGRRNCQDIIDVICNEVLKQMSACHAQSLFSLVLCFVVLVGLCMLHEVPTTVPRYINAVSLACSLWSSHLPPFAQRQVIITASQEHRDNIGFACPSFSRLQIIMLPTGIGTETRPLDGKASEYSHPDIGKSTIFS